MSHYPFLTTGAAAFACLLMANGAAAQDSRIQSYCGPNHANEVRALQDIRENPDGWYVASLGEQISHGDPRLIRMTSGAPYLCTRPVATPEMDAVAAVVTMRERTVAYLFVPSMKDCPKPSS